MEADFSPNSLALFLALTSRRAILVPLTESVSHKKNEFIEVSQGEIIICIDEDDKVTCKKLEKCSNHNLYDRLKKDKHPGLVLFTSGSTGLNKAVLHDLSALLEKYKTPRKCLRTLTFLLYDHIGGVDTWLYSLSNASTLITLN